MHGVITMKHIVALANTARIGAVALFSFAMVACGGADADNPSDSGELTAEEAQEATGILRSRGFDVDTLKMLEDGMWLIEGDVLLNPRDVLKGTAFRHDKGYAFDPANPRIPQVNGSYPVHLKVNTSVGQGLSALWQQAFLASVEDYLTNTNVTFVSAPAGAWVVELRKAPLPVNSTDPIVQAAWRCTQAVTDQGGHRITINSLYNATAFPPCPSAACGASNIEGLPADEKIATTTHELGHAFGLAHPPFPFADHPGTLIPGTAVYNFWAPYKSVMYWGCAMPNTNDHVERNLSADDIISLNTLYP